MSYSQNDEEKYILAALDNVAPARFLDIGAFNGLDLSNTARLAELGWGGVCVEPAPSPFLQLLNRYANRKDIFCVNAAVLYAGAPELIPFWDSSGDAVSTTERTWVTKWEKDATFREMMTHALPLTDLLRALPGPYHVVSIDTEGTSADIALAMPFDQLETKVVVIEHDNRQADLTHFLGQLGFRIVAENGENLIFVRP